MATVTNSIFETNYSKKQQPIAENTNGQEDSNSLPVPSTVAGIISGLTLLSFGAFSVGLSVIAVRWFVVKVSELSIYDWALLF